MYHLPTAEFRTPVASCCGPMNGVNENKYLADFPLLQKRVNLLGRDLYLTAYYRCAICGQVWAQQFAPAMHSDVPFLLKVDVNPDGTLVSLSLDVFKAEPHRVVRCGPVEKLEL